MDTFTLLALGLLLVFLGLSAWWAFRSFKNQHWVRFALAVLVFVILGFGWNYFPILLWLLLASIFGWSFS